MKKVKVYIVMNGNETNGHHGVLWFGGADQVLPLQVYAEKEEAEEMARKGKEIPIFKKVVEAELRFR